MIQYCSTYLSHPLLPWLYPQVCSLCLRLHCCPADKLISNIGLEKVSFQSIPKKGNAKECSNYRTIALISHTSKVMLKILQARLQQYVNREFPDVQASFRKGMIAKNIVYKKIFLNKYVKEGTNSSISCLLCNWKISLLVLCRWTKWLDGIIDSMDMSLSKLRVMVKDREARHAAVHGVTKSDKTEQLNWTEEKHNYKWWDLL